MYSTDILVTRDYSDKSIDQLIEDWQRQVDKYISCGNDHFAMAILGCKLELESCITGAIND